MRDKIKWFWSYYRNFTYVLLVLLILTPVQAMVHTYAPRLLQFSIDYVEKGTVPENNISAWLHWLGSKLSLGMEYVLPISFILLGLVSFSLYAFVQAHRTWMNRRLDWAFRQDAFDKMTTKGPDFYNKFRSGDLITRLTDDIEGKLSWFACSGIFRFYEALAYVVFTLIMMISINPWLTLMTAGPLPILIIIFFKTSTLLDKRYDELQTSISKFNAVIEACYSGIRVVKSYVQEKAQKKKFDEALTARRGKEIAAIKSGTIIDSMYGYIWQFGVIIVLLAGGAKAINAELTVGELFAFVYYVTMLFFPMFDIGQFLVKSRQSAISIDRLVELEKVAPMVADNGSRGGNGELKGNVTLDGVSFGFDGSERKIIDGITLDIQAGQTVAVVGKVGSGKTWLVNLLPRLVDPTGGRVLLDGHDLREFRLEDLRKIVGYVPQEPVLFSDTVRNNVRFGRDEISDAVMEWALEVSQLKDEITRFPQGLDTPIGTRGMSISGGQKQRLALARALVGKPKILILDDCTSALDSRTEAALWERLHEVMPGMTAILITHRPDTLERADNIFVLEEGKVIESGRHHQLMAAEGHYAKIYKRYQLEEQVAG
ncbi:MAG: ABC transporter ATP-binding protein/permease [candidate division Zixibacteria bacterium]|nr:ABC transporter ATP-binding protein/permease [candidate division Zixibacteria bacterium]